MVIAIYLGILFTKPLKSSSFVPIGRTFSRVINRAKPFQVGQDIFPDLNDNLAKERLVVHRRHPQLAAPTIMSTSTSGSPILFTI